MADSKKVLLYGAIGLGVGWLLFSAVNEVFGKSGPLGPSSPLWTIPNAVGKAVSYCFGSTGHLVICGTAVAVPWYVLTRKKNNNTNGPTGPVYIVGAAPAKAEDATAAYNAFIAEYANLEAIPVQDVGLGGILAGFADLTTALNAFYTSVDYQQLTAGQQIAFEFTFAPLMGIDVAPAPVPTPGYVPPPASQVVGLDPTYADRALNWLNQHAAPVVVGGSTFLQAIQSLVDSTGGAIPAY